MSSQDQTRNQNLSSGLSSPQTGSGGGDPPSSGGSYAQNNMPVQGSLSTIIDEMKQSIRNEQQVYKGVELANNSKPFKSHFDSKIREKISQILKRKKTAIVFNSQVDFLLFILRQFSPNSEKRSRQNGLLKMAQTIRSMLRDEKLALKIIKAIYFCVRNEFEEAANALRIRRKGWKRFYKSINLNHRPSS